MKSLEIYSSGKSNLMLYVAVPLKCRVLSFSVQDVRREKVVSKIEIPLSTKVDFHSPETVNGAGISFTCTDYGFW